MSRAIAFILTAIFAAIVAFGLSSSLLMSMEGTMQHCPFMGDKDVFCPMTLLEHVGAWIGMFNAPTAILMIAGLFCIAVLFKKSFVPTASYLFSPAPPSSEAVPVLNVLQSAFSAGILHPKLYA